MRERNAPLRVVIGDALRDSVQGAGADPGAPYRLPTRALGVRPDIDLDKALRLSAEMEDEEILRKLDLRK